MDMQKTLTPVRHERVHKEVLDRLARIEGHIRAVRKMWEENRTCPEILTQIGAVKAALESTARLILEDHMTVCVVRAIQEGTGEETIAELREAMSKIL